MNSIKKVYCRIFQVCFRIALPILPYRIPAHLDGIKDIPKTLKKENINSILLITDSSIRSFGITKPLEELLASNGVNVAVYDKTVANPTNVNVEEAYELYNAQKCNGIIGFGGGSSIDCAKAVGVRIAYPGKTLAQKAGILKVVKKLPPIFAIPTTAGTGSETTLAAVITDADSRHKYTINSFPLIPKYAVLDPEATRTLPKSLTATTGMDALTHAVEAYIGRSTSKETRNYSEEAVKLIFDNISTAYNNGDDMVARKNMLYASYLAGNAFTRSYVGYVHAVAHSLGGKYNVPHGLANAVILPYVLEHYGKSAHKKLHKLAVVAGLCNGNESDEQGARLFIDAIWNMQKELNIGNKISGIRKEDIPQMAAYADKEGNPLYPVPVLMDAKELEKFYYDVME